MKKFMKIEGSRLKTRHGEGHTKCPLHIEEEQWIKLVKIWDMED